MGGRLLSNKRSNPSIEHVFYSVNPGRGSTGVEEAFLVCVVEVGAPLRSVDADG